MSIEATEVPIFPKVYPHVKEIERFPEQQTIRLLWDRIHDLESRLQAAEGTTTKLVDGHNVNEATIASLASATRSATADAAVTSAAVSGGVDALTVASMVADASPFSIGPTPATFAPLGTVQVLNSPDVSAWAETSSFLSLGFAPGEIRINHSKLGQWPPVVIAPDGTTQEATIWVFFNIHSQWYATGGERLRPNQTTKSLGNPSQIGPGWLYDPNRWGAMSGFVPTVGDQVGFLIAAGSTRSDNRAPVHERTNLLLIAWPPDGQTVSFP